MYDSPRVLLSLYVPFLERTFYLLISFSFRDVSVSEELTKAVALKYHEKDTTLELLKVYPRSIKAATNCLLGRIAHASGDTD